MEQLHQTQHEHQTTLKRRGGTRIPFPPHPHAVSPPPRKSFDGGGVWVRNMKKKTKKMMGRRRRQAAGCTAPSSETMGDPYMGREDDEGRSDSWSWLGRPGTTDASLPVVSTLVGLMSPIAQPNGRFHVPPFSSPTI
ncbi:hypothetical protein BS78_02G049400 [Paspalum vaginatum]|nr:hypothetical protein BS78_02G049400 [Paspalum vaginatum]